MNRTLHRSITATASIAAAAVLLAACAPATASPEGIWGDPDVAQQPSLEFTKNGEFGGNDGCNVLGGEFTVDGGTITFGAIRSTLMYCEGVDTWLTDAATGRIEGDKLIISDKSGTEIGTLERHR